MPEQKNFIIWGSAGHAKVLADAISMIGGTVVALFDNNHQAFSVISGVPIFKGEDGFLRWIDDHREKKNQVSGLVAIGGSRGQERLNIQSLFRENGLHIPVLRHPSSTVSPSALLGEGTQILAHANVAADSILGNACIVNHRASVDHECTIASGVHLAPGAVLCGCVKIEKNVFIGAGAVVLPHIFIGENSVIGAGAIVTKNVEAGSTLIGNPALAIR